MAMTRAARSRLRRLRRLRRSPSCTSCCRRSPACGHVGAITTATATRLARRRRAARVPVLRRLRRPVPHRLRPRRLADRLARELPDHDGGPGRHAPVRGRRRGRHRAHRLGRCAARAWSGAIVACRMVAFLVAALRRLHGRARDLRLGPAHRRLPRRRRRSRSRSCRRSSAPSAIAIFLAIALLPEDFERRVDAVDARAPAAAARALAQRLATVPASLATGVRTAIDLVREPRVGRARRGRLVGVRHRDAVGVLPRLRRRDRRRSP